MESERLHFDDKVQSSKLLTVPRKPVELSSEAKSSNFLPMFSLQFPFCDSGSKSTWAEVTTFTTQLFAPPFVNRG